MAFCTQCGRELEEGQVCVCQRNFAQDLNTQQGDYNQNRMSPVQINIDSEKFNNIKNESKKFANNIFGIFLGILKKPVEAGKSFILSGNVIASVALIILQGIFSGLIGIICIGKINNIMQLLAGISNQAGFELVKFSLLRVFIVTLIGSVIISLALALITWGIVLLFKVKAAFPNILCAVGVRCIGMIPVTLAAVLMLFISVKLAIIIFISGALVGIIFMGCALMPGTLAGTNRMPYILFITIILSIVVHLFAVSKLAPMYFSDTVRIAYKKGIAHIKESLSDYDFDDIIESIMESYY